MFLSFFVLDDFFSFSKKSGFGVFLVHPTMVSVLLYALVERCFVSRMRDFFYIVIHCHVWTKQLCFSGEQDVAISLKARRNLLQNPKSKWINHTDWEVEIWEHVKDRQLYNVLGHEEHSTLCTIVTRSRQAAKRI